MKDFLELKIDLSIDEEGVEDFELPQNLKMQFLEQNPLNKETAIRQFFNNLNISDSQIEFFIDNLDRNTNDRRFTRFFKIFFVLQQNLEEIIKNFLFFY